MKRKGNLYLVPTVIAENTEVDVLPASVVQTLTKIRHFLVEDVRTARRFLSKLNIYNKIEDLDFKVLDKHTTHEVMQGYFLPVKSGNNIGILSESGCPGIADPGALAVEFAHAQNIRVVPLVGPSSILLALMASGLNGQQFAFHGYLPVDKITLKDVLKKLESESRSKNQTQIFIETPYRNNQLFSSLLNSLHNETKLCVALDVSGAAEKVVMMRVQEWKKKNQEWPKQPAVFLFLAQ